MFRRAATAFFAGLYFSSKQNFQNIPIYKPHNNMLRIAIQAKGRLNEDTTALLTDAGIAIASSKRKLIARASGFELEVLYLRDDDIPQAVEMGVADAGIVGRNEVAEKGMDVREEMYLGFGACRISLACRATRTTTDCNGSTGNAWPRPIRESSSVSS